MDEMKLQSKHRVTFSSDIEEYDDDEVVVTADEMENSGLENEEEIDEVDDAFEEDEQHEVSENEIDEDRNDSSNDETIISCTEMENIGQTEDEEQIDAEREEINTEAVEIAEVSDVTKEVTKVEKKTTPKLPIAYNRKADSKIRAQQNQILKIHLNVRKCCEFRYLENDRLPRYNGYISQYGLSKDQLDHVDRSRQSHQQKMNEKRKQYREAMARKSAENEEAFEKWLRQKQKTSKSRTKNMYDSK